MAATALKRGWGGVVLSGSPQQQALRRVSVGRSCFPFCDIRCLLMLLMMGMSL